MKISKLSKSAQGTKENPVTNVKAKSSLNRSILTEDRGKFFNCLEYRLKLKGGILIKVNPKHTGQTCPHYGYLSKGNRQEQAVFKCVKCGYEAHADNNILRAGQDLMTCQANLLRGFKQEHPAAYSSSSIVFKR